MQASQEIGRVVRVTGGEVWVDVAGRMMKCMPRGRLRARGRTTQIVAGDMARVAAASPDTGTIEALEPRRSWLSRYIEREAGERVVVANIDTLYVVTAAASPPLHPAFVDRVLVNAERGRASAVVIVNKMDLVDAGAVTDFTSLYRGCGYEVLCVSAESGEGIDELSSRLDRVVVAFVGESGVGKSSLLMKIDPSLDLRVGDVGERTGRGRHTTTNSQLFPFRDGYLADTPGVQTFGFPGDDPNELAECFPEFSRFVEECQFSPCTHSHEPKCGVKEALERGDVAKSRYDSYLNILGEVEARGSRGWR